MKNYEFSSIISKKKRLSGPSFLLYFQPKAKERARLGLSVSKKLGNAVERNRIKRQVRSMVDQVFDFNGDVDCILIVKQGYKQNSFEENKLQLASLLERRKHKLPLKKEK